MTRLKPASKCVVAGLFVAGSTTIRPGSQTPATVLKRLLAHLAVNRKKWNAGRWVAVLMWLAVAVTSSAADKFWGNAGGGNFSTNSNWMGGVAAGASDVAHFGLSDPSSQFQFVYNVNFFANVTTNSLVVEDDFVTFNLLLKTYTVSNTPFTILTQIGNQPGRSGGMSHEGGW